MGVMVREGLRRLCADRGWSYAVLWREAAGGGGGGGSGVRHLVWGEGHCETLRVSAVSGGHQAGDLKFQDEGGVRVAFERMKSEVHVVGYGLVGCAALTGNHRWINHNALLADSVGSVEIKNQLLSGIQSVAIIPVLPHGVVQLGSIHMIMEDTGFVNRVRSLVLQLGCLAGELVFDNASSSCHQNAQMGVEQLFGEGADHQSIKASGSRCVSQPSCSSALEVNGNRILKCGEMSFRSNSAITTASNSFSEVQQPKILPSFSSVISLAGEQHAPFRGNYVSSDLCALMKQQLVSQDIKSENKLTPSASVSGVSCDLPILEQLSTSFLDNPTLSRSNLEKSVPLHLDSCKYATGSYSQCSVMVPSSATKESNERACDPGRLVLPRVSQRMKAVSDVGGPNTFSSISYGANYPANKFATTGIASTQSQASASSNCCFMNANVSGDHNLQDEVFQNSRGTSVVHISATCSENILPQGCAMEGSNLTYGLGQLGSAFSQDSSCFAAEKRQSAPSVSPVPIRAESSSDSLLKQKSGNDLFDALGLYEKPAVSSGSLDCLFANMRNADAWQSCTDFAGCINQLDTNKFFDGSTCGTSSETFTDSRHDQLLDAVVSKVNMVAQSTSMNDAISRSTRSNVVDSSVHTNPLKHGQLTLSGQFQPELFGISPSSVETAMACSSVKSSCSMVDMGDYYSGDRYKTQVGLWPDDDQNAKSDSASLAQFRKPDEMGKLNRKRSKPGENPRPRPKDRQMIQDRVKELREIVPNGAKLSIDALLERTIKHMLFLQSVTKHADKLKEIGEPKIISKEGGLLLKDNFEGGATWAFEVGSQTMICPIIVEDLNPPRQLLVEMLCEERGFFLEIADLIRGLGLTILKGVMEARSDKIWARFAVEANRDVTRMDIFLSLVQLLEPRGATGAPQQGFDSTNMASNTSCPQIPPGASKPL